ncbi:glycoside hydrolase family 79 protein [Amanita thiersii Skay4041]|uniref:Glycoside hydrolase family 79 protein n=1 Tax=Amanita thiersii Skay4041 TaxID=703135 RepID=A0A2A9NY88_9AGAR|nr:glycoside hydrolase family 79 protein [Amanita thiersii Skay4041]
MLTALLYSLLSGVSFVSICSALDVSIPSFAPADAVDVSPTLLSLSIEQDRWTDWVGTSKRNDFLFNVLNNLKERTGSSPHIRIGANSEDHTIFDPNVQFSEATFPDPSATVPYPEAVSVKVGDGYYQVTQFLPSNTHVIWGVNLGQNNLSAAVSEAQSIAAAFASDAIKQAGIVLDAIEIGNEADLYRNNGARPANYNATQYVADWNLFAPNVSTAGGVSKTSHTKFWIGGFAGSSHSSSGFSPQAIFSNGILDSNSAQLISTFSQHHYSGSFCNGNGALLQDLMTKSSIRGNLTIFLPDITATRMQGLDYVLGETNSFSCHGSPGVSNTAGGALWTLDYTLFAASLGISRIFFHEGIGYKYNLIQPITLTRSILDGSSLPDPLLAHVQPQYYAAIIISEAIGERGGVRMVEININNPEIVGYAFFEGHKLIRAVLIHLKAYLKGDTERPSIHLQLNLGGKVHHKIQVKRLNIGHADDDSGLSWGGRTFETQTGLAEGPISVEELKIGDGLDLRATEAALLSFED